MLDGSARFTVDGDDFDVTKGGIVFLEDPALQRQAVALEPGTVVFAVGRPARRGVRALRLGGRVPAPRHARRRVVRRAVSPGSGPRR